MKYALTAEMAREVDRHTIEVTGLPSIVLMERAALSVAERVSSQKNAVLAVCGCGNNGADGVAAARILTNRGCRCDILVIGNPSHATEEFTGQIHIAENFGVRIIYKTACEPDVLKGYDLILDAIFGIGLSREVSGSYSDWITGINTSGIPVIAIDCPSGIDCNTGKVHGVAVRAEETVTFGYMKQGLLLSPGREYAGTVCVPEIGFDSRYAASLAESSYCERSDLMLVPQRKLSANKGTYGRILVIAGSRDMSGAAYLSGCAAYRTGCGIVEIFTHEINADVIRKLLPEAIVTGYNEENATKLLTEHLKKATTIIIGPGLSTEPVANALVELVLTQALVPLIIDADAVNILAQRGKYSYKDYPAAVILTPHIGELSRLSHCTKEELTGDPVRFAATFAQNTGAILVMKDAVTVTAAPDGRTVINHSGSPSLAKGGSGDVLTGIIAGLLSLGLIPEQAASLGVYLHGLCGEEAAARFGTHSTLATDVIGCIGNVLEK